MKRLFWTGCLILGAGLFPGCSTSTETVWSDDPLSVDAWRELEPSRKYDPATFDRLKKGDPNLETESGWHRFMVEVVVPQRRIDIPQ